MSTDTRLASERVIASAPMSYTGSLQRIWRLTETNNTALKVLFVVLAVFAILMAWSVITCWYLVFGLLLVPYRLLRRGSRNRKAAELRHREQLDALGKLQETSIREDQQAT